MAELQQAKSVSVEEILSKEKFRIFSMNLTAEELEKISNCRRGIIGASGLGGLFGFFGGRVALGSAPSSFLLNSIVIGASVCTGIIVGAGVSIQQSYNYLKSDSTNSNLSQELKNYSNLKRNIYKSATSITGDSELEEKLNEIFNKRTKRLPTSPKE